MNPRRTVTVGRPPHIPLTLTPGPKSREAGWTRTLMLGAAHPDKDRIVAEFAASGPSGVAAVDAYLDALVAPGEE